MTKKRTPTAEALMHPSPRPCFARLAKRVLRLLPSGRSHWISDVNENVSQEQRACLKRHSSIGSVRRERSQPKSEHPFFWRSPAFSAAAAPPPTKRPAARLTYCAAMHSPVHQVLKLPALTEPTVHPNLPPQQPAASLCAYCRNGLYSRALGRSTPMGVC